MRMNNATTEDARIEQLRKRDSEIRAQIVALNEQKRRKALKERSRLEHIVGAALLDQAERDAQGFGLMLKQVLTSAVTDKAAITLLRAHKLVS